MSRTCPNDGALLETRPFHGVTLDACPACGGLFFDEGEIAALSAEGSTALSEVERTAVPSDLVFAEEAGLRRCPDCDRTMHAYTYRYSSTIRLDGCEACGGVWVGDGELDRIAAHLRAAPTAHGGVPAARRAAEGRNAAVRHATTLRTVASRLP